MPQENTLKKLISLTIRRTTVDSKTVFFRNRGESVLPRQVVFVKQGNLSPKQAWLSFTCPKKKLVQRQPKTSILCLKLC